MATTNAEIPPSIKPRNTFVAFLLSLFTPGLGQVYNGQVKKGVFFFALILLNPLVFGMTRGITFFYGLVACLVISITLHIFILIDAIINARSQKKYVLKKYNTWYYYLLIYVAIIGIVYIYDLPSILGAHVFHIPTASNEPTIMVDDRILADSRAYNNKNPGYGDMVVFKAQDGLFYTKRIVGLPNDTIAINNDLVTINGKKSNSTFISGKIWKDSPSRMNIMEEEFVEEMPNGFKHLIYKLNTAFDSTKSNMQAGIIPSDCYFVLGDNRDNSLDSRYIGCINRKDIVGQILYTYWGATAKRININLHHSL